MRGADVKIVGCHWVVVPHGIMVKTGIDKMEDLKGKTVAVSAPGSFPDMLARVALTKFKLSPSDVRLAAVGGDRDRYTALVGGVVDAAVVSNEYLPLASSKNLKMLLEGKDALPNFLRVCIFSNGKALAERREDAIRYLTAQSKALRYALTHRDETDGQARLDATGNGRARTDSQGRRSRQDGQRRYSCAGARAGGQMSLIAERGQRRSRGMLGVVAVCGCLLAAVLPAASVQAQGLKAESLKTWRQAMILPKADAGFFLMAAKRGFAEREGLKVDVLEVKDDPIGMKALLSGEVDSYEGVYGAIAASARGADVKLLGCNWHAAPYVMLARPGIGSIEELRGKSIAASSPGTPPDMVARAALVAAKLPLDQVKLAAVGGDRDRFTALLGGVVDAAVVSNEYMPLPAVKDMRVLVEVRQVLPKFLRFCTLMTGKTLNERREDAVQFMAAQIKAFRYAVTHRDETLALAHEATSAKADDPRPAFIYEEGLKPGVVDPEFSIPVENLVWIQDQMIALGQLAKAGDIGRLVYPDIRKEALARIGK